MRIYKYPSIEIFKFEHNICIKNSISILEDKDKEEILDIILMVYPDYPRTKKSMFREWKSHNILHQRGIKKDSTKDVDFEDKPKLFFKIGYFLISLLMKERRK